MPPDHFRLVETVDRLGQGIVIAVADAADGRDEVGLGEALGVARGEVLGSPVTVMDQAVLGAGPAGARDASTVAIGPFLRTLCAGNVIKLGRP